MTVVMEDDSLIDRNHLPDIERDQVHDSYGPSLVTEIST